MSALAVAMLIAEFVHAGTISGTINFEGRPPPLRMIPLAADPVCVQLHKDEPQLFEDSVVLGEGQTLANVLIQVVSPIPEKEYPVPTEPFVLSQQGCMYSPHVMALRAGQQIKILNPDKTSHNIHFYPKKNSEFNRTMRVSQKEITHSLKKAEPTFVVKCEVHTWMRAYCTVFDHPFFAVTGKDGRYELPWLPAGDYEVKVWHERFGEIVQTVSVPQDGGATLDHTYVRKKRTKTKK